MKNDILKKKLSIIVLNLQNDFWNIIHLHQVLNIGILQLMGPKKRKKVKTQFIMLPFWFFKKTKI
jgi:hypothetical protein